MPEVTKPGVKVLAPEIKPRYRLLKPFYCDDTYIQEGVEIEFIGTPNEFMEPLNEPAREKLNAFLEKNGGFTPRIEDITYARMLERPKEISLPQAREIPLMGSGQTPEPQAKVVNVPGALPPKRLQGTIIEESNHGAASI